MKIVYIEALILSKKTTSELLFDVKLSFFVQKTPSGYHFVATFAQQNYHTYQGTKCNETLDEKVTY